MNPAKSLIRITRKNRLLTAEEFRRLADVPAAVEWFRNIDNTHTERAYRNAIADFMRFTGIRRPEEFRLVTRAHVIAWRDDLVGRHLDRATIRHRLSALASLLVYRSRRFREGDCIAEIVREEERSYKAARITAMPHSNAIRRSIRPSYKAIDAIARGHVGVAGNL